MVLFDNNVLCLALHPNARPPAGVERAPERIQNLLDVLAEQKERVIIPTPALSEFLILAGADGPKYITEIRNSSILRIEPFDERAAIELADMEIAARTAGDKRGSAKDCEWQKVKIDRQIVAIAKVHNVSAIYSDDPHIAAHGKDCKIRVLGSADLKLPPPRQMTIGEIINEQGKARTDEDVKPASVDPSGSSVGPRQDQAGAEDAAKA